MPPTRPSNQIRPSASPICCWRHRSRNLLTGYPEARACSETLLHADLATTMKSSAPRESKSAAKSTPGLDSSRSSYSAISMQSVEVAARIRRRDVVTYPRR